GVGRTARGCPGLRRGNPGRSALGRGAGTTCHGRVAVQPAIVAADAAGRPAAVRPGELGAGAAGEQARSRERAPRGVRGPMLEITNLSKSYRGPTDVLRVLQGLTLTVSPGEFVAVQGRSGCGKTTLLLAAGGLLHPDTGRVAVAGQDLYALSD